jgi:hypothetical protein
MIPRWGAAQVESVIHVETVELALVEVAKFMFVAWRMRFKQKHMIEPEEKTLA